MESFPIPKFLKRCMQTKICLSDASKLNECDGMMGNEVRKYLV